MSDEKRVDVEFGAKIGGLLSGAREATAVVRESTEKMKGHLEGLTRVVEGLKAPFIAVTALLAGGAIFGEAIHETAELGEHLVVLSQKTGATAEDLSRLRYAADIANAGAENLDTGLVKLARAMGEAQSGTGTAAAAFAALGIKVKGADGQLRPMKDVLLDVAQKFAVMKDGAGKSALAMDLFGKSGTNLIPMLNEGAAGIQKLEAEADRLGVTMSTKDAEAAAEYGDAMHRLQQMTAGFARSLVLEIMPALTDTVTAITSMRDASGNAEKPMHPLATAIRFVAAAGLECYAAISALAQGLKFLNTLMSTPINGQFLSTVKKAWFEMGEEVTKTNEKVANALLKLRGFGGERVNPVRREARDGEAPDASKQKKTKTGADERLAAWKDELTAIKQAEDLGKDTLLVDEISFWQAKLRTVQGGAKADIKLRQQINAAILAADKQLHRDELEAARVVAQGKRDAALEGLDVEKRAIDEQRSFGQLSAKEAEAQLIALNQRVLAIKLAALEEQRALAAGDLVKQAEIDNQIAAAKRASAREIVDITKGATKSVAGDWETLFGHVTNVFSQSVNGIIAGTQTLRGALRGIFQGITLDFLASKAKELQHHAAIELAKRGITTTTALHKVATEAAAALKSLAITVATALKQIAVHAAVAAAGAFAAIAAIPFVGPVLAPIAAGAALIGVLALGSKIASAAGGYDVPAGVNPMTQLHAEEMVLPANLANAVRAMAAGGASDGSAPSSGGSHTYVIHAMDAKSFEEFARRNPAGFARGVQAAVRGGHLARTV